MTGKSNVVSPALAEPNGHFAQATEVELGGRMLFVSGMTARNRDGGVTGIGDVSSQTRQVLSSPALRMRLPSGVKATWATQPVLWPLKARTSLPVSRSHKNSIRSAPLTAAAANTQLISIHPLTLTGPGWLPASASNLTGPFSHAWSDIDDDNVADSTEEVTPSGGDFQFPFTPFDNGPARLDGELLGEIVTATNDGEFTTVPKAANQALAKREDAAGL